MENTEQKDFKQIFEEYMEAYKNGGFKAVEKLIEDNNLTDESKDTLTKANELLMKVGKNKEDLEENRKSGKSAEEWMATKLNELVHRKDFNFVD